VLEVRSSLRLREECAAAAGGASKLAWCPQASLPLRES
jgi:hypothetical protein